jgi:hypothetical protein
LKGDSCVCLGVFHVRAASLVREQSFRGGVCLTDSKLLDFLEVDKADSHAATLSYG